MNLFTFLFLMCFAYVYGATYRSKIDIETGNGRIAKFCKHGGLKVLPGSEFRDNEKCLHCTCSETGLDCHTLPSAARIIVPDDTLCISRVIGCQNYWVMRYNNNLICHPDLIPKHPISVVGK